MASSDYIPTSYPDFSKSEDVLNWTGRDSWNAIYTITIDELIDHGVFDWTNPLLDWSDSAYNKEQYERCCNYFIDRFRFREISIEPFYEWANCLHQKLVYELMPKFRMMYKIVDDDFDIMQIGSSYNKGRDINSNYPETLLSGNSDYITNGRDFENENVQHGNALEIYLNYVEKFKTIDTLLLDSLETMFISLYTVSIDGA